MNEHERLHAAVKAIADAADRNRMPLSAEMGRAIALCRQALVTKAEMTERLLLAEKRRDSEEYKRLLKLWWDTFGVSFEG